MAIVSQIIEEGPRNLILHIEDKASAAGVQTNILKVAELNPPCKDVSLVKVIYSVNDGNTLRLFWAATVLPFDTIFSMSSGNGSCMDFRDFGGITNARRGTANGNVLVGTDKAGSFSLVAYFKKIDPILEN